MKRVQAPLAPPPSGTFAVILAMAVLIAAPGAARRAPTLDEAAAANLLRTRARQVIETYPLPPEGTDPVTITLPISAKAVGSDGRTYTITGTFSGQISWDQAPDPTPQPPQPTITALKNLSGQAVTTIRSGEVLVIEGQDLIQEGWAYRVQIPGRTAIVQSGATPTRLPVKFPVIAQMVEGPVQIYWSTGSGWTLVVSGPRITVVPALAPSGKPKVRGSFHESGREVTHSLAPDEPFFIRGEGFGSMPGRVVLAGWEAPLLSWSEREIRTLAPPLPVIQAQNRLAERWALCCLELTTAEGERYEPGDE